MLIILGSDHFQGYSFLYHKSIHSNLSHGLFDFSFQIVVASFYRGLVWILNFLMDFFILLQSVNHIEFIVNYMTCIVNKLNSQNLQAVTQEIKSPVRALRTTLNNIMNGQLSVFFHPLGLSVRPVTKLSPLIQIQSRFSFPSHPVLSCPGHEWPVPDVSSNKRIFCLVKQPIDSCH